MRVSFTFNNVKKPNIYLLNTESRPLWSTLRRDSAVIPLRAGAYPGKLNYGTRQLEVPIGIKHEGYVNLQKLKEELASWLIHSEPRPLVFDDESDRTYYAVIDGATNLEEFLKFGKGVLFFTCYDPFKYGTQQIVPLSTAAIHNDGSEPTNLILNITFSQAASEIKISHNATGQYVRVIYNFVAGDRLTIDLTKRKIIINDNLQMATYDWKSRPFQLLAGSNNFTVSPSNVANIQMIFTPRWL